MASQWRVRIEGAYIANSALYDAENSCLSHALVPGAAFFGAGHVVGRKVRLAHGSRGVETSVLPCGRERVGVRARAARLQALLGTDEPLQFSQDPSHGRIVRLEAAPTSLGVALERRTGLLAKRELKTAGRGHRV